MPRASIISLLAVSVITAVSAHEHHAVSEIDMGEPIDAIMWIHMILQMIVWGFLFPIGMVLGLSKSRWHVPLQSTNLVLTAAGIFLGHHHKGRQFPATSHGIVAWIIVWLMISQASLGIYLKLHIHEESLRPYAVKAHSVIGAFYPVVGWLQMLLGVITLLGYCMGGELGQCLAHYIMGSAFIGYATILLLMVHLGPSWLAKRNQSQEFFDSLIITIWGFINTFTEHHDAWNKNWSHKDMQHTMMGVLWFFGGLLGLFLSRKGKRSFVPAVIIIMTGWGMSAHEQALMISSKIHALFGYSLMSAGVVRIIEVCFVLKDGPSIEGNVRIFQYLTPYLLVLGGTMFMSATDEEMRRADSLGIDHVTYALFVFSLSFLIFLHISFLIHLYSFSGKNAISSLAREFLNKEGGYKPIGRGEVDEEGPESFELAEAEHSGSGSGDENTIMGSMRDVDQDAKEFVIKDEREGDDDEGDEVDWMDKEPYRQPQGLRI